MHARKGNHRGIRRFTAALLCAALALSTVPIALADETDTPAPAPPDTTPRKISVMQRQPDTGELTVTDGMELHELNLAYQDLCRTRLADKTMFNQQAYFPDLADELYTTSYICTSSPVSRPGEGDTRPDAQSPGDVTAFTQYVTKLFSISPDGSVRQKTIDKVAKVVTTYYIDDKGAYKSRQQTTYTEESVTDEVLDTGVTPVTLGVFPAAGSYEATGNTYVKSVGGVSTSLYFKKFRQDAMGSTAGNNGSLQTDAALYDGDSTTAGFNQFGAETA